MKDNYLKSVFILIGVCLLSFKVSSQVGIGTSTPHASAVLDITSTNKGVLLPRLNSVEMLTLQGQTIPKGLILYCTDCSPEGLYVSDGSVFSAANLNSSASSPTAFSNLVNLQTFENAFPNKAAGFYSYQSFNAAINYLSDITIVVERRQVEQADATSGGVLNPGFAQAPSGEYYSLYLYRTVRKKTGLADVSIPSSPDWDESWNLVKPIFVEYSIDYSDFLNNGSAALNAKELAGFFAQISHETSGDNVGAVMNQGLVWKEEIFCSTSGAGFGTSSCAYTDLDNGNDVTWPPSAGKTYHGRGPIQLSWNYNFGFFSFVYYGDKNVLLEDPDIILNDSQVAFASAISFWMLPSGNKPSAHSVINNVRGFATTTNIINGGLECGTANDNTTVAAKVQRRIDYFLSYSSDFGHNNTADNAQLQCFDLTPY